MDEAVVKINHRFFTRVHTARLVSAERDGY